MIIYCNQVEKSTVGLTFKKQSFSILTNYNFRNNHLNRSRKSMSQKLTLTPVNIFWKLKDRMEISHPDKRLSRKKYNCE